jgi:hypothetical protein
MKNLETLSRVDRAEANPRQGGRRTRGHRCGMSLRVARLSAAFCVSVVSLLIVAPRCYGQCPLHVPTQCQQLVKEREELIAEQKNLQADMKDAVGQQKSAIASQIKSLSAKIAAKLAQMESCGAAHGVGDVPAVINGSMALMIDTDEGFRESGALVKNVPFNAHINMIYQHWTHDQFVITWVPQIVYKFLWGAKELYSINPSPKPLSSDCGSLDPKTGRLSVTLTMPVYFEDTKYQNQIDGPYTLSVTLSNTNVGSWWRNSGNVTLIGDGIFQDGSMKGHHCQVSIAGTLQPLP